MQKVIIEKKLSGGRAPSWLSPNWRDGGGGNNREALSQKNMFDIQRCLPPIIIIFLVNNVHIIFSPVDIKDALGKRRRQKKIFWLKKITSRMHVKSPLKRVYEGASKKGMSCVRK